MPLPKPSEMISKRLKKPKLSNSSIKPPPAQTRPQQEQPLCHSKCWQDHRHEWRVRVVCTDPDATDDSLADEAETPASSSMARKRLIHEICLPVPSSSLPNQSTTQNRSAKKRSGGSAELNLNRRSGRLCRNICKTGAILQDIDALLDVSSDIRAGTLRPPPPHHCALILSYTECAASEEFLSEFMPEDGSSFMWDYDLDRRGRQHEGKFAEMLDFELDPAWINSLERLP